MSGSKISFGFTKLAKKPSILTKPETKEKIQYIDSVEGNSFKIIGNEENTENVKLVIPLKDGNKFKDRMINAVNKNSNKKLKVETLDENMETDKLESKNEKSLDELAASEILRDINKKDQKEEERILVTSIELTSNTLAEDEGKESTIDDYECVPISNFGLAMLRGMGWDRKKGIGKNPKVVKNKTNIVRPKGLGLGAESVMIDQKQQKDDNEKNSRIHAGAMIRIIGGKNINKFGIVKAIDDNERWLVKLAATNEEIICAEFMILKVTQEEYIRNTKHNITLGLNEFKPKDKNSHKNSSKSNSVR